MTHTKSKSKTDKVCMQCYHDSGGSIIRTFYAIFKEGRAPAFKCENNHEVTYDVWMKSSPYIQDMIKKKKK